MNTIIDSVRVLPTCVVYIGAIRLSAGIWDLVAIGFDPKMRGIFRLRNESIEFPVSPSFAGKVMRGKVEGLTHYHAPRPAKLECMRHPATTPLGDLLREVTDPADEKSEESENFEW